MAAGVTAGAGVASASTPQQAPAAATSSTLAQRAAPPVSPFVSAPVTEAPASVAWNVSLVADNTDIVEGETATLTAYSTQPLDGSGYEILIYGFSEAFGVFLGAAGLIRGLVPVGRSSSPTQAGSARRSTRSAETSGPKATSSPTPSNRKSPATPAPGTTIIDRSLFDADLQRFGGLPRVHVYNYPELSTEQSSRPVDENL